MSGLSRSILKIGAGLLSARAALRLKGSGKAIRQQQAVFRKLLPKLGKASVWSRLGVGSGMAYGAFRAAVPLQTYETLAPHFERMKAGEAGVLWPGKCQIYAETSGTTSATARRVPVTEAMMTHLRKAGLDSILWYLGRTPHSRIFTGRHLAIGGSVALAPIAESEPFEAYAGDMKAVAFLNLPGWLETHLYEPGTEIAGMADWPDKVAAITERTLHANITLLAGIPSWVLVVAQSLLERASRDGGAHAHLQEIWPNLECFVHGGIPIGPFQDELRSLLGPTVNFHEVYASSEAFVAAQDADAGAGLRLMTEAGIFYEFLPMSDFDPARLDLLGTRAVPLSEVSVGGDYALVVTTPAGLARYLVGDIVRFTSTEPPRLIYVGRTELRLNAFAEEVIERELTEALLCICRRNGWTISNFHVAPLFPNPATGALRGRHEWWVELRAGTLTTPTGPVMAGELDTELRRTNPRYDSKRTASTLDPPFVRLVMPGVFEQWMKFHGKWGGQNKMPRCRSDRVIADELGAALQFAKD